MNKNYLLTGILATLVAGGMTLTACSDDNPINDGKTPDKHQKAPM